jgi:hypothetical protein
MSTPIAPEDLRRDLSQAIAACEIEVKRLTLQKCSPVIVLWLEMSGYAGDWNRLDYEGFANLWRFLKKCK